MEQNLTYFEEQGNLKLFKLEHENQDVHNLPSFKKWLKKANEYVDKENKIKNIYGAKIYTICFCKRCNGYSICYFTFELSCVTCSNCDYHFCSGCSFEEKKKEYDRGSLYLKGFLKLLYIRTIYKKFVLRETYIGFNILFIISSLLFTPLYLGLISFMAGFSIHNKRTNLFKRFDLSLALFSLFYGLLMIPYMILFFFLMTIILIPSIFNKMYFYSLFVTFLNLVEPNNNGLDI